MLSKKYFIISVFILVFGLIISNFVFLPSQASAEWVQQDVAGPLNLAYFTFSPDGTRIVATSNVDNYIYISTDGGESWVKQESAGALHLFGLTFSLDGTRIVATSNIDGYVYISTDGGETWLPQESAGALYLSYFTFSGTRIVASSTDDGYVYISTDGGETWIPQESAGAIYLYDLTFSPDGTKIVATSDDDGYVYISTDGGETWIPQESAEALYLSYFTFSLDGTRTVATSDEDSHVYISTDGGDSWVQQEAAGLFDLIISPDGTIMFATSNNGYIYTSTDGGETWLPQEEEGLLYLFRLTFSPDGTIIVATSANINYVYIYYVDSIEIPTLTTDSVTDTTTTGVTLTGTITDNGGEDPDVYFDYGADTNYEENGERIEATMGEGNLFSVDITGLTCGTEYSYRAVAINSAGEADGDNQTFTTSDCPTEEHHHTSSGSLPSFIKQFQQAQTPIIILNNLNFSRNLRQHMTGDDIKSLQGYLNTHNYNCGLVDGIFGKITKKAVILFQKANGLVPDGIVGPKTLEKMK